MGYAVAEGCDIPRLSEQAFPRSAFREIERPGGLAPGRRPSDPPFEVWLQEEQRLGFYSTFFFLADRPPAVGAP